MASRSVAVGLGVGVGEGAEGGPVSRKTAQVRVGVARGMRKGQTGVEQQREEAAEERRKIVA